MFMRVYRRKFFKFEFDVSSGLYCNKYICYVMLSEFFDKC